MSDSCQSVILKQLDWLAGAALDRVAATATFTGHYGAVASCTGGHFADRALLKFGFLGHASQ